MAELRTDVASLSIDLAERIVERNLDRDTQPPARRQLHQPGREQLSRWPTASTSTRRRCSRSSQAEGHLDEVEDELFRFARIVEGNDDLRMTLAEPGSAARAARRRSSTSCSRTARCR